MGVVGVARVQLSTFHTLHPRMKELIHNVDMNYAHVDAQVRTWGRSRLSTPKNVTRWTRSLDFPKQSSSSQMCHGMEYPFDSIELNSLPINCLLLPNMGVHDSFKQTSKWDNFPMFPPF